MVITTREKIKRPKINELKLEDKLYSVNRIEYDDIVGYQLKHDNFILLKKVYNELKYYKIVSKEELMKILEIDNDNDDDNDEEYICEHCGEEVVEVDEYKRDKYGVYRGTM